VNTRLVLKYLGLVLVILGGLMLIPLACSLISRDHAQMSFVVPVALAGAIGALLWRSTPAPNRSLTRREALALVALSWSAAALVGALPYVISGVVSGYVDALFEAMSGFTTTGATVLTWIGGQPRSILLWRNFSQWIGGMGIITIFVALLPMLGIGAARLFEAEITGLKNDNRPIQIRAMARALWLLYVGFSVLLVGVLSGGLHLPFYDALLITFATLSTGGFLHMQESIGAYANVPLVMTVVTVFMLLAGTNFSLYYSAISHRRLRGLFGNMEFRVFIGIFLAASVAITVNLVSVGAMPWESAIQHAAFQVASIQTTTGFTTADYDAWPALSRGVLLVLMVVGGCAGSTAGGLKVVRIVVIVKYASRHIRSAFSPRLVTPVRLESQVLSDGVVSAVVGISFIFSLSVLVGFLFMSVLGLDTDSALSAVIACVSNVGPGLAAVGPAQNYALIPDAGKLVLTVLMLIGRLEFVSVLALFYPMFWRWR